ncbi:uncharacterized protein NPIL_404091 [Nephila pilipes]|uniref:Uncharacterized protein n=1 Tax=Nephila pilipes TaxID=299642 RepID=A0A8X6NLN5_NEPPI|nr:uncharacterized protein NPIL_404091 [Nephila pilipes]
MSPCGSVVELMLPLTSNPNIVFCKRNRCENGIIRKIKNFGRVQISVVAKSSLSDFSSDEEMKMLDDLTQVRNFSEIDTSNPPLATPFFPFAANRAVHKNIDISDGTLQFLDIFFDDNLLEMIVAETNQYADQFI